MKHIKLFENTWATGMVSGHLVNKETELSVSPWTVSGHLVNKDTGNLALINEFIKYFKINKLNYNNNLIVDIWNIAHSELGLFPNEITPNNIAYLTKDGCKLNIKIEHGEIKKLVKIKSAYIEMSFKHTVIADVPFTFTQFLKLLK